MKRTAFMFFLLIFTILLSAQTTYQLSVSELFDKGIQNSLNIKSSIVKNEIANDQKNLALKKRLPEIALKGSVGYVGTATLYDKNLSFLEHPTLPPWSQDYQVVLNQPLFEGGRIKKSITRADLEKQLSDFSLEKDKSSLKLWLIGKYLDLFNFYKRGEVYQHNIAEAKERLKNIQRMKEEGMITTNDVLRSQLAVSNYELTYEEIKNNITIASQQLDILLGMDENIIIEPDMNLLDMNMAIQSEVEYVNQSYSQYPEIKIAKKNVELAQNNLSLTKSTYFPTLSFQAYNSFARPIPNVIPAMDFYMNVWGLGVSLSFNISSFFSKKDNMNQAKRQISLSQLAVEQEQQTIRTAVKAAYIKHKEALDRIKVLEKSMEQSNENYRIVKNKYFNRLSILTDMLDANAVLLDSELQLTSAKTNAIYTYYQLQEISGNL